MIRFVIWLIGLVTLCSDFFKLNDMNKIINIPTIKNDDRGYLKLFKIVEEVLDNPINHFDFDFSQCSKLDHNAVVMLGGLANYVHYQASLNTNSFPNKNFDIKISGVMFLVDTMSEVVVKSLQNNNFLSHFSNSGFKYNKGDYIGYREHEKILEDDEIVEHLNSEWLTADKLKLSDGLKPEIVSRILEIFLNAYGHGIKLQPNTSLGVYSCGQYDPKEKKLHMSVLDFGVGIVENVKSGTEITDSLEAMRWALARGNSTRTDSIKQDMPRGLGFDLLHQFVCVNKGELRIYSNDVVAVSDCNGGINVHYNSHYMKGTMVSITIVCDGAYYSLSSEKTEHEFF